MYVIRYDFFQPGSLLTRALIDYRDIVDVQRNGEIIAVLVLQS